MDGITFFGKVDREEKIVDGKIVSRIKSEYPAWFLERNIDEMDNEISLREGMIERGETPPNEVLYAKQEIAKLKARRDSIMGSKPKIEGKDKDKLAEAWKETGDKISESKFTRSQMEKGTADAHEEARRMSTPCVKIHPHLAELVGISLGKGGMVNRVQAEKAWQIGAKFLGESTNTSELQRD